MFKTGLYFCVLMMASCVSLFAQAKYDIMTIVPQELLFKSSAGNQPIIMHESGYISGSLLMNEKEVPYIYHVKSGEFKLISGLKGSDARVAFIDQNGFAAGSIHSYHHEGVFVYNFQAEELIDLRTMLELQLRQGEWEALSIPFPKFFQAY